jgi:hypothetical protein
MEFRYQCWSWKFFFVPFLESRNIQVLILRLECSASYPYFILLVLSSLGRSMSTYRWHCSQFAAHHVLVHHVLVVSETNNKKHKAAHIADYDVLSILCPSDYWGIMCCGMWRVSTIRMSVGITTATAFLPLTLPQLTSHCNTIAASVPNVTFRVSLHLKLQT